MIDVNLPEETPATKTNELLEGLAVSGEYINIIQGILMEYCEEIKFTTIFSHPFA